MYRATAPAATGDHQGHPGEQGQPDVPLPPRPLVHPPLERVHAPLRLGLGEVDTERIHLGDALEILAHERNLGLPVDVARVELVQELRAGDRPQHQLPLSVQPFSPERLLRVFGVARIHGGSGARESSLPADP